MEENKNDYLDFVKFVYKSLPKEVELERLYKLDYQNKKNQMSFFPCPKLYECRDKDGKMSLYVRINCYRGKSEKEFQILYYDVKKAVQTEETDSQEPHTDYEIIEYAVKSDFSMEEVNKYRYFLKDNMAGSFSEAEKNLKTFYREQYFVTLAYAYKEYRTEKGKEPGFRNEAVSKKIIFNQYIRSNRLFYDWMVSRHRRNEKVKNIVLIGMPGCGKSTVGIVLAKMLGYRFVDSDLLIQESENRLLSEIIEQEGLDGFNRIENRVNAYIDVEKSVIATGGSVVYGKEAMEHLKKIGVVVYIKLPYEEIEQRLGNLEQRGVSIKENQSLQDLYEERVPLYEKYADVIVEENNMTISQTALLISDKCAEFLKKR